MLHFFSGSALPMTSHVWSARYPTMHFTTASRSGTKSGFGNIDMGTCVDTGVVASPKTLPTSGLALEVQCALVLIVCQLLSFP